MPSWIINTLFMCHMDEKHYSNIDFQEMVVVFSQTAGNYFQFSVDVKQFKENKTKSTYLNGRK